VDAAADNARLCGEPVVVSLMQSRKGVEPFFWFEGAGTEYRPTLTTVLVSLILGDAELRDCVSVSAHTTRSREVWLSSGLTSSAALELMKNSVPPACKLNAPFGAVAGQTVKPACFSRTAFVVSI
jgi:hypothetical protein